MAAAVLRRKEAPEPESLLCGGPVPPKWLNLGKKKLSLRTNAPIQLLTELPCESPYGKHCKIWRGIVDDAVLVQEESIIKAMKLLHVHAGVVAEPSAAVGLAALLENPGAYTRKTIATIICGGNMTQEQLHTWLC